MQSLGEIELRAPAVGAKLVFFGGYSSNKYCVRVYGFIFLRFTAIFSQAIVLSDAQLNSHICR